MIKLHISANIIHGMLALAPKDDYRDCFNGVFVDILENEVRLVATDGRIIGVYRIELSLAGAPASGIIRHMKRKLGHDEFYTLSVDTIGEKPTINLMTSSPLPAVSLPSVDFPEYMKAFPDKCSGEAGYYNLDFITQFAKAKKLIDGEPALPATLYQNGPEHGALIKFADAHFVGLIMPYQNRCPLSADDMWWDPKQANVIPLTRGRS